VKNQKIILLLEQQWPTTAQETGTGKDRIGMAVEGL